MLSQLSAIKDESSEDSHVSDAQLLNRDQVSVRTVSWRSRRRPINAPAVRRKEKELLAIQAERSEMKVRCNILIRAGGSKV